MPSRFEKFSERARRVLSLAQEEAQRFNHNYIGTEHILLGLVVAEWLLERYPDEAEGEIEMTPVSTSGTGAKASSANSRTGKLR